MTFRRFKKRRFNQGFLGIKSRKSVFGGRVKSVSEIEALSHKIQQKEAEEFAEFEKVFDADLRTIS